ncbi:M23 family metallopeptidase [Halobacteriovorax sp. HLS]|uniref:M23 family metallopeptidase n=1 Tax=Halobacteriovorax sp. HLS TaxID=2234000 RepID=UPI000FD83B05|nr:M23 family metallopeptidase [Halobacteriovorax sp. HLS]
MKKTLLTLLAMNSIISPVLADDTPVFLWDNQEGLIKASSCKIIPSTTIPFRISGFTGWKQQGTENLRNYNGVKQSHLVNGSILKLKQNKQRRNYEFIEVVGINTNTQEKVNRWYTKRSDSGYLFKDSIHSVEDYILEVDHKNLSQTNINELSEKDSSFWLAESSGSYYKMNCDGERSGRNYSLFRVYNDLATSTSPSAFVGVYEDESSIFSSIKSYKLSSLQSNYETFEAAYDLDGLISKTEFDIIEDNGIFEAKIEKNFKKNMKIIKAQKEVEKELENESVTTAEGFFEEVVCIPSSTLNVRDDSLDKVLFKATTGEVVKKFQSFDNEVKELTLEGTTYEFVKVEFPAREEKDQRVGWVASDYVKQKSKCKYLRDTSTINQVKDVEISGIDDEKCCEFPTVKATTHSYTSGMRMFNARRGGGTRSHAACDLYRYINEPILSVAPGKVVRNHYYFYQGTYAIEVVHSGGFIVRYGELSGKKIDGINNGSKVKMGQQIGYMGKVNSNCCRPMLHFELFKGTGSGPLSTSGNKYKRRSDLMDPTNYLKKWEIGKF